MAAGHDYKSDVQLPVLLTPSFLLPPPSPQAFTFELEAFSLLIQALYGFLSKLPIHAYGETIVLFLQARGTSRWAAQRI